MRRFVVLIASVVALIVASAAPAGALDSGLVTYFSATYNGQIQCAQGRNDIGTQTNYNVGGGAYSYAAKDLYCSNYFYLPQNWIGVHPVVQRYYNSNWYTAIDSGLAQNYATNHWVVSAAYANWISGYWWRMVTQHIVIVAGDYRQTLIVTGNVST